MASCRASCLLGSRRSPCSGAHIYPSCRRCFHAPTLNETCGRLRDRDVILVERLTTSLRSTPARGQVVVLRSPNAPRERMVKRVLALPGDRVAPRNRPLRWNVVPPGHVWVEGDNSSRSNDSTEFGCVRSPPWLSLRVSATLEHSDINAGIDPCCSRRRKCGGGNLASASEDPDYKTRTSKSRSEFRCPCTIVLPLLPESGSRS